MYQATSIEKEGRDHPRSRANADRERNPSAAIASRRQETIGQTPSVSPDHARQGSIRQMLATIGQSPAAAVARTAPPTPVKKIMTADPKDRSGVAGTADYFFSLPPKELAKNFPLLGGGLSAALSRDRKKFGETLPAIIPRAHGHPSGPQAPPAPVPSINPLLTEPAAEYKARPGKTRRRDVPKPILSGQSDPGRAERETAETFGRLRNQYTLLAGNTDENKALSRIRPRSNSAAAPVKLPETAPPMVTKTEPELAGYLSLNIPNSVDSQLVPHIKGSLNGPRNKMQQTIGKRDAGQKAAAEKAQSQADRLGQETALKQQQQMETAQTVIREKKEAVLKEGLDKVQGCQSQIGAEKTELLNDINNRVAVSEAKAEGALNRANRQVRQKRQEANRRIADERRKAEKKKKSRPWYKKIGDFFAAIAKALKNTVRRIASAVGKVVRDIISSARDAANRIIDACTTFITQRLNAFSIRLKQLSDTLLAAYPALRERVNRHIEEITDRARTAIQSLARGLKKAVDTLAADLSKAVDVIARAAESMLSGILAAATAVIKGDFSHLASLAFETACKVAGVPPEKLKEILANAGKLAGHILTHPGEFAANLVKAVVKGFTLFADNLWENLKTGLMSWLVGQLATASVEVPAKLSAAAIFSLIGNILGINYAFVRDRAVQKIGPEKVERLEKVLNFFKSAYEQGPDGVWERLKNFAVGLKEKLFKKIADWAVIKVAKKGLVKLTSLFIPGAGFVQAILSIWQTLKWFIEKGRHIVHVVTSIFRSIREIAAGKIDAAAQYIHDSIKKVLPLVFGWLARMVGLKDIGAAVLGIIKWLRKPVVSAIDKAIGFAMTLGKTVAGFVKGKFGSKKKHASAIGPAEAATAAYLKGGKKKSDIRRALRSVRKKYGLSRAEFGMTSPERGLARVVLEGTGSSRTFHLASSSRPAQRKGRKSARPAGSPGVMQRAVGFEFETMIQVEISSDERYETLMTVKKGNNEIFKVVTDAAAVADPYEDKERKTPHPTAKRAIYSIFEIVTAPVDEFEPGGRNKLKRQIRNIRVFGQAIRETTRSLQQTTTLAKLGDRFKTRLGADVTYNPDFKASKIKVGREEATFEEDVRKSLKKQDVWYASKIQTFDAAVHYSAGINYDKLHFYVKELSRDPHIWGRMRGRKPPEGRRINQKRLLAAVAGLTEQLMSTKAVKQLKQKAKGELRGFFTGVMIHLVFGKYMTDDVPLDKNFSPLLGRTDLALVLRDIEKRHRFLKRKRIRYWPQICDNILGLTGRSRSEKVIIGLDAFPTIGRYFSNLSKNNSDGVTNTFGEMKKFPPQLVGNKKSMVFETRDVTAKGEGLKGIRRLPETEWEPFAMSVFDRVKRINQAKIIEKATKRKLWPWSRKQ